MSLFLNLSYEFTNSVDISTIFVVSILWICNKKKIALKEHNHSWLLKQSKCRACLFNSIFTRKIKKSLIQAFFVSLHLQVWRNYSVKVNLTSYWLIISCWTRFVTKWCYWPLLLFWNTGIKRAHSKHPRSLKWLSQSTSHTKINGCWAKS